MELWLVALLGIICNLPVGWYAYRKQALTVPGGIIAAGITGYFLFIVQPIFWLLLLVFFSSSTLLTRFKQESSIKQEAMSLAEKGGERDAFQVLANAGIPLILAIIAIQFESPPVGDLLSWYAIALAIGFAVVNADTWATELGVTSKSNPRWILNPTKTVPRGTSGGVSIRGLLASFAAALSIALVYLVALLLNHQLDWSTLIIITIGGLLGSLFDSLLGATLQGQYFCPSCKKITEQTYHTTCGTTTEYQRGLTWFTNDFVNFFSVILAILVMLLFLW